MLKLIYRLKNNDYFRTYRYTARISNLSKNEIREESLKIIEPQLSSVSMYEKYQQDDLPLPKANSHISKTSLSDPRIPQEFEGFLRLHTNNIKYMQCDKCDFICRPLMTLFLKHYQTHADCLENTILSDYIEDLRNDVNESESVEPTMPSVVGKRFQCSKCTKSFNQRKSFCRHLKIHEKRVYPCNECECKFKTKLAFKAHKERHRRPKELLHCDQCDKDFRSKDGYKYHRENRCILIKCRLCEQTFGQTVDLKEHMKLSHDITLPDTEQEHQFEAQTGMCFICGKIVKDSNLERHMRVHMEEKPFVCDLCGKRFKFKSAIRDHMMIKLGMKDYVCEICGRKFVKKCYLNKHIRFHAGNKDQKNLQCDVCSEQFVDKKLYILHKRSSHDPEKPFLCDLCNKSYTSKASLRQHLVREVICTLCDEIFTSNDLLKQHVILVHTLMQYREAVNDENDSNAAFVYPCEICGRKFTSEERYKQHQLTELSCELCYSKFTQNEDLKIHIENKHDPTEHRKVMSLRWKKNIKLGGIKSAEFPCDICGKKLFYRRTLLLHMRMHSGLKPYKCEYCNKAYTSKHSLNAHLISEKNLRKFACSYCGKRYNFNSDLIIHVKQRHESRQFSCHVCGKKFGLLKYLKDHSTIHSQVKPFNCEKCKMGFRLRKFLIRHNKKYHSTEDEQVFYIEVGADE